MARPFENPSSLANNPNGVNYKRFALIAGGIGAALWYIGERRNARNPNDEKITDSTLRPETGTTMQVGTNREQQQHRYPPPSKKTAHGD